MKTTYRRRPRISRLERLLTRSLGTEPHPRASVPRVDLVPDLHIEYNHAQE